MTNKDKITDIQYLINEFYSTDEDRGELNESAKDSQKIYNQYCKDIRKDLEVLEILKSMIVLETMDDDKREWEQLNIYFNSKGKKPNLLELNDEDWNKLKEWLEK